jgi:hypothetical protein
VIQNELQEAINATQACFDQCALAFQDFGEIHEKLLVGSPEGASKQFIETLNVLSNFQIQRARAVFTLLSLGMQWDSEILMRSFYEANVKTMFLASHKPSFRQQALDEFWGKLNSISDRKASLKADITEEMFRENKQDFSADIFKELQNNEMFEVDPKLDRRTRKALENKWSFSNMAKVLSAGNDQVSQIIYADSLLHGYGMSSEFIHASARAFDLLLDRALRKADLPALEQAHISRILSDLASLVCFSLYSCERAITGNVKMNPVLFNHFKDITKTTRPFMLAFEKSQNEN